MNGYRKNNRIKGAGTALVTPFAKDGSVDVPALKALVRSNIAAGIDFLCVLGTTAETPTLSEAEKKIVRKAVLEENAGRVPLLLGYGGNNTAAIISAVRNDDLSGFDALLIVAPYYNKPNQEGLFRHFKAISEASPLPILLYNIPGRTGVNINIDTICRIADSCPNVVGVKEASGNIVQIKTLLSARPEGFVVISGDDSLTLEMMGMGADGVISVASNARPAEMCAVVRGDAAANEALSPLYKLLFAEGSPTGIKALLAIEGKMENILRLPLVEASEKLISELREFAKLK